MASLVPDKVGNQVQYSEFCLERGLPFVAVFRDAPRSLVTGCVWMLEPPCLLPVRVHCRTLTLVCAGRSSLPGRRFCVRVRCLAQAAALPVAEDGPSGGMRSVCSRHLCWCPGVPAGLLMRPQAQWWCLTLVLLQVLLSLGAMCCQCGQVDLTPERVSTAAGSHRRCGGVAPCLLLQTVVTLEMPPNWGPVSMGVSNVFIFV